jgi:haloalkane dehalogenase
MPFIEVLGSNMYYNEQGDGKPVLFLHDIPTSSYLWRDVLPQVSKVGRCIAPDLIGLGKSDCPNIPYRIFDHIKYIEEFINQLNLNSITLVLHGIGSIIGLDYAMRNQDKVASIIFLESYLRPSVSDNEIMASLPMQHVAYLRQQKDEGFDQVVNQNYVIEKILPGSSLAEFTPEEMAVYSKPFNDVAHRKLLWQCVKDVPAGESTPKDVTDMVTSYSEQLQHTNIPKLLFYAVPGYNTTIDTIMWAKQSLKNLKLIDLGEALHYFQKTMPSLLGQHIANWVADIG